MSIQVIAAVLDCRDKELTSSRRMVLVSLANYAGDDGHSWPSQERIAAEAGCGVRSVKDHLKWLDENGFIERKTKRLGQGNGSRTSYYISPERLRRTTTDRGEQTACANIARAKSVDSRCSIPPLTNRQEPSITDTDVSVSAPSSEQPKKKSAPRGAARGSRISENWAPTPKDYAFASEQGLTREEINREADRFRNYWLAATGRNAAKRDWEATWRNWLTGEYGIVTKKRQRAEQSSRDGGRLGAFDRLADRLEGRSSGIYASGDLDGQPEDGGVIDAEYRRIEG